METLFWTCLVNGFMPWICFRSHGCALRWWAHSIFSKNAMHFTLVYRRRKWTIQYHTVWLRNSFFPFLISQNLMAFFIPTDFSFNRTENFLVYNIYLDVSWCPTRKIVAIFLREIKKIVFLTKQTLLSLPFNFLLSTLILVCQLYSCKMRHRKTLTFGFHSLLWSYLSKPVTHFDEPSVGTMWVRIATDPFGPSSFFLHNVPLVSSLPLFHPTSFSNVFPHASSLALPPSVTYRRTMF